MDYTLGVLHLQDLNGLRQNQLAVHTLRTDETDLAGLCIQFVQTLEGATLAVGDPVVLEVTEEDVACGAVVIDDYRIA